MFHARRSRTRLAVRIIAFGLVLVAGIWAGGHPSNLPEFMRGPLVGDDDTRVVQEAIDQVHESYYREIPKPRLADQAVRGIVDGLGDRFSQYLTPVEYKHLRLFEKAEFSGVGMSVLPSKLGLRVADVFDESPADRAGIRPGDLIVAANGKSLKGLNERSAVALIKGPEGSRVRLTYLRRGRERTVTVVRATVTVPVVAVHMRRAGQARVGIVKLSEFSSGAHGELVGALRRLLHRRAAGFVLDLRGNGGGLVKEAQLVSSAFLRGGPVVTTRGRHVPTRTLDAGDDPVVPRQPLVVLVDRGTASASEIVAGALQDRDRAVIVGTRTFGKGVFQELIELSNGGALDITAGQYFTPNGRNLGGRGVRTGRGITPDVPARDDPRTRRDEALDKALSVLGRRLGK